MRRTFNCGVGMIVVVSKAAAEPALEALTSAGENAWIIGRVAEGGGEVSYL